MFVLQIETIFVVIAWFAFCAINNGGTGWLWILAGAATYLITHVIAVYVFDAFFPYLMSGSVADYGIHIISRFAAIAAGIGCCFVTRHALISMGNGYGVNGRRV